ncbi:MAG: AraC family transcriptional regulator [Bacteroidota bacterium]
MQDFFKYLTPSEEDKKWGIFLNVAGRASIAANTVYPNREHPTGYYFTWERGRELEEYQLIYITEGKGILEHQQKNWELQAGQILLIRPNEFHRYRPDPSMGWVENYIGFNGRSVRNFYQSTSFLNELPVFHYGIRASMIGQFEAIFKLVQAEKPGFQQIATGLILQILGNMIAHQKRGNFSDKAVEKTIQKILLEIRAKVEEPIDLQTLAKNHHISYASFRKLFKKYTGKSPRQYHLELKLLRAKELILSTDKSMQEISRTLHFESIHYFSRFFKQKTGMSPTELRKTIQ